ncbi:MAG: hypothetical protein ACPL2D_07465 [Ignavibacteria bacterium]
MIFYRSIVLLFFLLLGFSCGKYKSTDEIPRTITGEFKWSENISVNQIPETPVKGFINGKEINIEYINYENWIASKDNVINFSSKKPSQNCGFVEYDVSLTRKNVPFPDKGEFLKENFSTTKEGYNAVYFDNEKKVTVGWNCALVITETTDKVVRGKIAICFKDEKKSWIAGTFEAIRCRNL